MKQCITYFIVTLNTLFADASGTGKIDKTGKEGNWQRGVHRRALQWQWIEHPLSSLTATNSKYQ